MLFVVNSMLKSTTLIKNETIRPGSSLRLVSVILLLTEKYPETVLEAHHLMKLVQNKKKEEKRVRFQLRNIKIPKMKFFLQKMPTFHRKTARKELIQWRSRVLSAQSHPRDENRPS